MTSDPATAAALATATTLAGCWLWHRRLANRHARESAAAQERFQQQLRHERDEHARLLDSLGDVLLQVDDHAHILAANAAAREWFGQRELVGRPAREVLLDDRLVAAVAHCLSRGTPVRERIVTAQHLWAQNEHDTHGTRAWLVDAARVPAPDGSPSVTRVVLRDVTAEHQTEQIRRDFVANASHELRTPLAIINGYLENLLDDAGVEDPAMTRHFLGIMHKHAERISRIVEDMLVISRLESGEAGTLNVEPFGFRSCALDVIERLEPVIREHGAELRLVTPTGDPRIHGDRFYWTQVMFNLIENSLKQNPRPGLRVEVGCTDEPGCQRIWVNDNGIGIPAADLPHIFRRFYRVQKHHSQREIKGTGLGLSIVKRAVEAHGGTIDVHSIPGRETQFTITLPR